METGRGQVLVYCDWYVAGGRGGSMNTKTDKNGLERLLANLTGRPGRWDADQLNGSRTAADVYFTVLNLGELTLHWLTRDDC